MRLKDLAAARVRWGYRKLHVLLGREGWKVNHKRVYRLYRAEGLQVPRRRRKRVAGSRAVVPPVVQQANQQWAMDFVQDTTATGQPFRALTLVDTYTRECHAIEVARSLPSERVIRVLERMMMMYGRPERIRVDNGPEFVSRALDQWARAIASLFLLVFVVASQHRTLFVKKIKVHSPLQSTHAQQL